MNSSKAPDFGRPHSPEWVIMVVSRDAQGKPNVMPAGWGMHCSGSPPYMAVSIGYGRYTYRCIHDTGEFVFAWAGEGQAQLVEQTGSTSGRDINKFEEFNIASSEPTVVNVPLLDGAASNLECRLVHEYESGDHAIFVGEVVASHQPEPPIRRLFNFKRTYMVAVAEEPS